MTEAIGRSALFGVLLALSWITVTARVYVRRFIVGRLGVDDHLILPALFCFTVLIVLLLLAVKLGFGEHSQNLPQEHITQILKVFYISELLYFVATVVIKISVAILLFRFAQSTLQQRIIVWTATLYTVCSVCFILIAAFQCWPPGFYWDSIQGTCFSRPTFTGLAYTSAATSLVTDGIFTILPIILTWKKQMERKAKILVGIVLGSAISITGINIARFNFLWALHSTEDVTYNLFPIAITIILEIGMAIITASLATLKPLLEIFNVRFQKLKRSNLNCHKSKKSNEIELERLSEPQKTRNTRQEDYDEWDRVCIAAQKEAASRNQHRKDLVNTLSAGQASSQSRYHASQDVELPPMLQDEIIYTF